MTFISLEGQIPKSFDDLQFEDSIGVSQLGTLLFDDITFPAGSYKSLKTVVVDYDEVKLQSVRFIISQEKNIVKTAISGRSGTVKEYNNDGDYQITLQANINEIQNIFPATQLQLFKELKDVPESIPVVSKILNSIFDIDDVVINDFSLDPGTGKGNVVLNFKMESDLPFDIKDFEIT